MDEILSFIFRNQWLVLIIIGLVLVALAEVGFRAGLRLFVKKDEPRKGQIGAIQGAVLGMLALLLGFTFSMAVARYETRRDLVLRGSECHWHDLSPRIISAGDKRQGDGGFAAPLRRCAVKFLHRWQRFRQNYPRPK
jgi:hypothetical protein